jgi:hypothetical protein
VAEEANAMTIVDFSPSFVGRHHECDVIMHHLALAGTTTRVVMIAGEPGIGKFLLVVHTPSPRHSHPFSGTFWRCGATRPGRYWKCQSGRGRATVTERQRRQVRVRAGAVKGKSP